jgi:hypothetical protein
MFLDETKPATVHTEWPPQRISREQVAAVVGGLKVALSPAPVHVLIDPFLGEPRPLNGGPDGPPPRVPAPLERARSSAWEARPVHDVEVEDSPIPYSQLPYLVELNGPEDPLLAATVELAMTEQMDELNAGSGPMRIGGWLQSVETGRALAQRIAGMLLQTPPRQYRKRYLRVADRRVLILLHHVLPPEAFGQWLGPVAWHYLNRSFDLEKVNGVAGGQRRFPFTLGQWRILEAGESINRSLAAWLQQRCDLPDDAMDSVIAGALQASAKGFAKVDDCMTYILYGLAYPGFENLPAVQPAFEQTAQQDEPLAETLADLPPTVWKGIPLQAPAYRIPGVTHE